MKVLLYDTKTHGHHLEYIRNIATYLTDRGDEVLLLTTGDPKEQDTLPIKEKNFNVEKIERITNEKIRRSSGVTSLYYKLLGIWELSKRSEAWGADVVNILSYEEHILAYTMTLVSGNIFEGHRLVLSVIVEYFLEKKKKRMGTQRKIVKYCFGTTLASKYVNSVTVLSEAAKKKMEKEYGKQKCDKVTVIPDPVKSISNNKTKTKSKERIGLQTGKPIVLFFGRVTRTKGACTLLEAIEETDESLCWVIAGEDLVGIEGRVKKLKRKKELQSETEIIYRDRFIKSEYVEDYFVCADLVILPYRTNYVGTSGVLQKAAAAEVPVLATKVGLVGKVVEEWRMGKTAEPDDPKRIARAVDNLIKRPNTLEKYKTNMSEYVRSHSWLSACETLYNEYTQ